jgi:hypothetical protein
MSTSPDISGWCATNRHNQCDGVLHRATGYHWWCACIHHDPIAEPTAAVFGNFAGKAPLADYRKAWRLWRRARDIQEGKRDREESE